MALVQSSQERYTELLLEARGVSGTALDKLSWLIEQYLQKGSTSTNFWIVLQAQATEVLNPEEKAEINQTAKANRDLLADIIRDGQSEGTIVEGDAVELATLLLSLFQSTSIWGYRGFGEPSDHAADIMLRLVVRK